MYVTRHVTGLPRGCCVGDVDYARLDELDDCRRIVRQSATRADNVGIDEYADDRDLHHLLQHSEIFAARSRDSGRARAFIVIQPCLLTRTWDPCWAEIHVFYTAEIADADAKAADVMQTAYNELLTLALEYVVTMDVGYSECVVRVASSCQLRYDVARRHDFVVIATIPNSVDMSGVGLCDDFFLAKSLQLSDRPRRSVEQISAAVEKVVPSNEFDAVYCDVQLPTAKFLPRRYIFESGLTVNVRSATKNDMPRLYAVMKSVADTGQGYGVDEFPTLNAFCFMTSDLYVVVVEEDNSSRKLVAFLTIGDSWYVRSKNSRCCEGSLVVSPEFQGCGIGLEMVNVETSIEVELGYTTM